MLVAVFLLAAAPQSSIPTGAQVLQRAQAAYDAVKTLEQDVEGRIGGIKGTAKIAFARPGRLRVTGDILGSAGMKYELLCDGKSTWVFNAGQWKKVENPESGIATVTGISANAATLVPATLFHTGWGSLVTLKHAKLTVARETVGGRPTYRVEAAEPYGTKIWVDARTSFFVKTESSVAGSTITVDFAPPKVDKPIPASRFKK